MTAANHNPAAGHPLLPWLAELLGNHLGTPAHTITPAMTLAEDLNCDSLDAIEIQMALEDAYRIEIPDDEVAAFVTVADILAELDRRGVKPPMTRGGPDA
jgi:acyl carrier protein